MISNLSAMALFKILKLK